MRIAVDVCVGKKGIALLRDAGHDVVVEAEHCESDRSWFARAVAAKVDLVIAADNDLEILCWDNEVDFCRAGNGLTGVQIAQDAVNYYAAQRAVTTPPATGAASKEGE